MKSESPSVSDSAVGNVTNEAALKEISAQLRSNKKHVKKLRREVRDNKEDTKNLLMKLRQEFRVNKKHLKTLHREVQDGKKEIEDCKKRNNMARIINQGLKDARSELMPLRNHRNEVIEGVPDWVESFWSLTEKGCDRIAREMDFPFFPYTEPCDKPRNILQATGWGGDVLEAEQEWRDSFTPQLD